MTDVSAATPVSQQSGLPAPAAPAAPAPVEAPATPAQLSGSPVNADSSSSAANQAAVAAAEAPAPVEAAPAPAVTVTTTGVEAFDQVGRMLGEKGITNAPDILAAAAKGELSLADKAAMVEALGPDVANLAMAQLEGEVARQREAGTEQANAQKAYADKALGTEGAWESLVAFAQSAEAGFTPADQQAIDSMLADGGVKGEWAINEIVNRFKKSQGFSQAPNLLSGDGATQAGFEPLSKANYATEMREAQNKYGEGSKEVEALRSRRMESLRRGF